MNRLRRSSILWLMFSLAIACLSSLRAFAQDALVTFYNHGSMAKSGLPGTKHGVFAGSIFDGKELLFSFVEGKFMIKNNRFLTLHISPGSHSFSASYRKQSSDEKHVQITLEPGKHYFFSAQAESSGVIVCEVEKGRLDQVDCVTAQNENMDAKQLIAKHSTPALLLRSVSEKSFPSCQ